MSDGQPKEPAITGQMYLLTLEMVREFFTAKGVKYACPACGHEVWQLAEPVADGVAMLPMARLGSHGQEHGINHLVTIMCANCGLTRMHSAALIAQWIAGRMREASQERPYQPKD